MSTILELYGNKYSRTQFDGYRFRAKVLIKTSDDVEHTLDIYTTDSNKSNVELVMKDKQMDNVVSLEIIHFTTKEQDDLDSKFIDLLDEL